MNNYIKRSILANNNKFVFDHEILLSAWRDGNNTFVRVKTQDLSKIITRSVMHGNHPAKKALKAYNTRNQEKRIGLRMLGNYPFRVE